VYLFVVDTCVADDELAAAKASVTQALQMIPEYCHVGLVTYGTHVHVHELGFAECSKCYVFRGGKEYTSQQVVEQLGLRAAAPGQRPGAPGAPAPGAGGAAAGARQFILPLSDPACDTTINNILSDLQRDAYPVVSTQRPARCTGTALVVAEALLGASVPPGSCMARVMLFVGGPSTEGPGKVIGRDLSEEIRRWVGAGGDSFWSGPALGGGWGGGVWGVGGQKGLLFLGIVGFGARRSSVAVHRVPTTPNSSTTTNQTPTKRPNSNPQPTPPTDPLNRNPQPPTESTNRTATRTWPRTAPPTSASRRSFTTPSRTRWWDTATSWTYSCVRWTR
jgi:hypothetical protein